MANTFTALYVHVVFSTRGRAKTISDKIRPRLHAYLGGIARNLGVTPMAINGTADHVHLLLRYPSRLAVADIVCKIKANGTTWIHETFSERSRFAWQSGYSAFSVSESRSETVRRYIERQQIHHREMTFAVEIADLIGRIASGSVAPDGAPKQAVEG